MTLFELKKQRADAIGKAEGIFKVAETANRLLTEQESKDFDACMAEADALSPQIQRIEKLNTMKLIAPNGRILTAPAESGEVEDGPRVFSKHYLRDFKAFLRSKGRMAGEYLREGADSEGGYTIPTMSSSLTESVNTAGGFAVPSFVEPQIIPLARPKWESIASHK